MEALAEHFEVIRPQRGDDLNALLKERKHNIVAVVAAPGRPVRRELIEALPNLEIIANFSVGFDHVDLQAARERGIAVTNTPDVLTDDTADTALALILATARRIVESDMIVRVGRWGKNPTSLGVSLKDKRVGIVGLGRIGRAIATRCEAFGMSIAYHNPRPKDDVTYRYFDDLKNLAHNSDFLVLACPASPATENMIDYSVLEALGAKGFLINIARGSVVKEEDLLAALSNKIIAGAGLDVYANEPNVPEGLLSLDNVVLLPHIGSATVETRTAMGRLVIENLLAHFEGRPLKTPVAA
jgi:lactate dehydrogenase-like 2-hydroxyacid dehydrogenase